MEPTYYTTIGLEIHAELKTKSKMFCGCKNDPDETIPNKNICPVCTAQPGALPVINKEAVKQVVRVGLAVGATIAEDFTEFDRKNYFYPDIPKGYQISQYKYPIVSGGRLADFAITRIHLEEDTGNSKHDRGDFSLVDFNRAGVPLMELVTDAHTFNTADEAAVAAGRFAREYQLLLWYLGASEANMEKGEMRVEANISVSTDPKKWGTKVEVKNLNSIRSAERAIRYETLRMIELIEAGRENEIIQETRGWDENKQATFSQRSKEDSQEYRYFPDPDLPKLVIKELFDLETLRKELPELPDAKRIRYKNDYGIKNEDIETFVNDPELGKWYETVMQEISKNDSEAIILLAQIAANFTTSDYLGIKKANPAARLPSANYFAELVTMFYHNEISSRAAKDILVLLTEKDFSPKNYASEHNLLQKNDENELKVLAQKIINENETVVATYKAGKENAIMSLVGKIMKETGGSANPQLARQILIDLIK
jgi:aspartyl-tRNA(Asn)/glutamyl-tRNA(Gln) amidotransferase subunit B